MAKPLTSFDQVDTLCINTIRTLAIDAIQRANSGHPGLPLGAAPMAYVLWQKHLKHSPKNPNWPDRDRFVLSAGHGSMLLYSLLHLTGYSLKLEDLQNFRQWESLTPGHPEFGLTAGVEATTGPLGQGSANAVGMALAERALANLYNRPGHTIVDHFTYALVSDGDLMEGISAEAASLAGHLKLGKLIYLYDANDVTLDGPADLCFSSEDVAKRYESYQWQVQTVENGDTDPAALDQAITRAREDLLRPSLILIKTTIGYGSPNKAGKSSSHGAPLGDEEITLTKKTLGWKDTAPFSVPADAQERFLTGTKRGDTAFEDWKKRFEAYRQAEPELAGQFENAIQGELPKDWETDLPRFEAGEKLATRVSSGKILNALAKKIPYLIGGDADLGCSTNTILKEMGSFEGQKGSGRNIHYGVREHAMAAIANGLEYHRGLKTFTATFFCFSDYMRPAIRLAALNKLAPIYVWTHDSIGLGEDGPTHQPVEHLMSLRCMPNLVMIRPCDANETREAWKFAIQSQEQPVGLVLTRQKLPTLDRTTGMGSAENLGKGAYVLCEATKGLPHLILIGTGSEVTTCLEARTLLEEKGVPSRVVSMPSWELFEKQPESYREEVFPRDIVQRASVEAGVTLGWERWIGNQGIAIGVDRFGASAPGGVLFEKYGLTAAAVAEKILRQIGKA